MLLRKVAYPYENVDDLKKLHEATLPEKDEFYSNLNMEDITDKMTCIRKELVKTLNKKHLGECHDFYLKGDALSFTDIFENFRKLSFKNYNVDPVKFISATGIAWQAAFLEK